MNVLVADKQNHLQYLPMEDAVKHCTKGTGIWDWKGFKALGSTFDHQAVELFLQYAALNRMIQLAKPASYLVEP